MGSLLHITKEKFLSETSGKNVSSFVSIKNETFSQSEKKLKRDYYNRYVLSMRASLDLTIKQNLSFKTKR